MATGTSLPPTNAFQRSTSFAAIGRTVTFVGGSSLAELEEEDEDAAVIAGAENREEEEAVFSLGRWWKAMLASVRPAVNGSATYVWVCICICVCMYLCMYVCMYAYIYVCIAVYVFGYPNASVGIDL